MYKRVLLKLSGESLGGPAGKGIDEKWLERYAVEIADAVKAGLQVGIVIGGGGENGEPIGERLLGTGFIPRAFRNL